MPSTAALRGRLAALPRRVTIGALALAVVGGVGIAAAATGNQPTEGRIIVPPVAVEQTGGISRLPALPALGELAMPARNGSIPPQRSGQTWGLKSSPDGIPQAAFAAYERAARLISVADAACKLDWALLAGIGKVESDHGRWGGNALDDRGRATPGIYGIPLNGLNNTARITDTDAGTYDRDYVYDRAVGPMQFIPGTWRSVGVDADDDGVKDPQNMADAATSAASTSAPDRAT